MVAAAVVAGSVITAGAAYEGSKSQAKAANNAAEMQQNEQNQIRYDLSPYRDIGQNAINPLWQAMGYTKDSNGNYQVDQSNPLQQKFSFTPDDLQKYPGYQWALQQGMQGVNASAAARGLGVSGADVRGAAQFANGLASQTYGQAYDQALTKFQANYNAAANNANRLYQLVGSGQNAATQTGSFGSQNTATAGNLMTSGAAAGASGLMGAANAFSNGAGNYMNYTSNNNLANAINNASAGGGTSSGFKMPTLPSVDTNWTPTVSLQ